MAPSKNPRRYADCQRLIDIALVHGSCDVEFDRSGQAVNMKRRVYLFQKLMENLDPDTPYTGFRLSGPEGDNNLLRIQKYSIEAFGGRILTKHSEAEIAPPPANVSDNPVAMAEALLREEGLYNES